MNTYWKNFIKSGNPNGEGLLWWDKFTEDNKSLIVFDQEIRKDTLKDDWDDRLSINQGFVL